MTKTLALLLLILAVLMLGTTYALSYSTGTGAGVNIGSSSNTNTNTNVNSNSNLIINVDDNIIIDGDINVESDLQIFSDNNDGAVFVQLSNGQRAELRTTPEEAKESARAEMKTQCADGCDVDLVEVRSNSEARAAYRVEDHYRARFLAIFPINAEIYADVDAETGQVLNVRKSFIASLSTRVE